MNSEFPASVGMIRCRPRDCFWLRLAMFFTCITMAACPPSGQAEVLLNEILFNPPGSSDSPNEYIELRGIPNLILPSGTYLVAIEGDTNGNPGTVQNLFNLSGKTIGGNGFLVLLQKSNSYPANASATFLVNSDSGPGWGTGSSSSIGHRGEGNQTDLENPSVTFSLIQTPTPPGIGDDIDSNDDGVPDGAVVAGWTILDSVGVLDSDGAGDFAYGAVSFRRDTPPGSTATATGIVVPTSFTPSYVGRRGNSTGSTATDWVAGDGLTGTAPAWALGSAANTFPASLAGTPLNHLGNPNFNAPPLPGIVILQTGDGTEVTEGHGIDTYAIALNTAPAGTVFLQLEASGQIELSVDGNLSFHRSRTLACTDTTPKTIGVRAAADHTLDVSPRSNLIAHSVAITGDPAHYPLSTRPAYVSVKVVENSSLLLNELKVNPPGGSDEPNEFVEIKGEPEMLLTNVYFVAVEGDASANPGKAELAVNLTSLRLGRNGLLVIAAQGHPYAIPGDTTLLLDPSLSAPGGALGNGAASFLLVSSPSPILTGDDLDDGNNGNLKGFPKGTTLLDTVGWRTDNTNDLVYGGVTLAATNGLPDAATRFSFDSTPRAAPAWFFGDLAGNAGDSLAFDKKTVSPNFPTGTPLTPGSTNNSAPFLTGLSPISGVIGDPHNPTLTFRVTDLDSEAANLSVTATSSNHWVAPDANLIVSAGPGGLRTLAVDPVGVGYSTLTLTVTDGVVTNRAQVAYAASAPERPGGRFHAGTSDGSTAIPIDDQLMLVGDDENQVLRLYRRFESGYPLAQFDLSPFLDLADIESGVPREVDIEGSTRIGQRLFWIGAHSHANIGEMRLNRGRIFATDLAGNGLQTTLIYAGRYDFLKEDLVNWDRNNVHGKGIDYYGLAASTAEGLEPKSPDGSGFNIEGLAMAPGSVTTAYVACRAPIVPATNRQYALIVPVLNFATLAVSGAPAGTALFGAPIELDLYGRGIRSLEGNQSGYVMIGGPAGDLPGRYPQDFRLYTWTGQPEDIPQQRAADLTGLNPEGIVNLPPSPWTGQSTVDLISDNGKKVYYGDDIIAKHLLEPNFKKFRSDTVVLGEVVKPAPVILSTRLSEAGTTLTWRALRGERYQVQFQSNLAEEEWSDLEGEVLATGPLAQKSDPLSPLVQRFYRVVLVP